MFKKGDFVVNTNNGICEIKDITIMNMSGTDKEYYLLIPVTEKTAKTLMRHILKMKKNAKKPTRTRLTVATRDA